MTQVGQENRVILTADDFTGSPFRLLHRVGSKLYRPTQGAAMAASAVTTVPTSAAPTSASVAERPAVPSGAQIWDWG